MIRIISNISKNRLPLGLFVVVLLVLLYNLYFLNSYYPLTEGWFSTYASELNQGKELYKDIYYLMPPLYPKMVSFFTGIFGYDILYLRITGIFVVIGISVCIYLICTTFISPLPGAAITIVVVLFYQHGNAHIAYDFIQVMNLFLLLSTLGVMRAFMNDAAGECQR
ncbi:MAG TPA: hypothetical protein VG737_15490, partial [Cyclobacteriaceae bacterium]|nr:hypothetical protein [Cyclobacteriaceae bacterium]